MITLYADYHTHTRYSHGKGWIIDNVMAARKKGLTEIAITDHSINHISFGVKEKNIIKMREEIDNINANTDGIKVLLGLECNIISLDGDVDITDEIRKKLDILLVGYHMMVMPKSLKDVIGIYGRNYLARVFSGNRQKALEANTNAMIKAIHKYKMDIITHPGARIPMDTGEIAREAAKVGTALEINAHSSFMTDEHVKAAALEGVRFVINSDAHHPDNVGNFGKGLMIAEMAGLKAEQIINAIK